jgi:hypothetical protein
MHHTENQYINAGYLYERAPSRFKSAARASTLREMLDRETPADQTEARRLIELGRKEARATNKATQ